MSTNNQPQYSVRCYTTRDTPAVTGLLNACLIHDAFTAYWVQHKIVDDPDYEPELALVAEAGGELIAFAQAVSRSTSAGCIKMIAVAPPWQRQGIASALLDRLEQALTGRSRYARVINSRPNYFLQGLDPRYTPAASFFLMRGYERQSEGFNMGVDLRPDSDCWALMDAGEEQLRQRCPGLRIVRPSLDDADRVIAWLKTTGCSGAWQYQALHAFRKPERGPGDGSGLLIAELDGAWIGFAVYDGVLPGCFGPEWVSDEQRGRGIGKALLFATLRAMRDDGYETCEIGLVGPLPFYAKSVGAVVSRTWWMLVKDLGPVDGEE